MTATDQVARAYVSAGIWVARCPQLWCLGADHFGPGPVTGRVGGLGPTVFRCPRCTTVCDAVWPDDAEDIWHLLAQRPMVETRNWEPGETLADLVVENAIHGLIDPDQPGGALVLNGQLANRAAVLAPAAARYAIGAR